MSPPERAATRTSCPAERRSAVRRRPVLPVPPRTRMVMPGAVFADTTVHGTAWGISFEPAGDLGLHHVLAGEARLRAGRRDHHLVAGDLAIVRQALSHSLTGSAAVRPMALDRFVSMPS